MSWDSVGHFLWLLWVLPTGSIWSNLAASVVTGIIVWMVHLRAMRKVDEKLENQNEYIRGKLTEHHNKIMETLNGDRNATLRGQGRPEDSL